LPKRKARKDPLRPEDRDRKMAEGGKDKGARKREKNE